MEISKAIINLLEVGFSQFGRVNKKKKKKKKKRKKKPKNFVTCIAK